MRVELTPEAAREIAEIESYSRRTWGAAQTRRYMATIRAQLRKLRHDHRLGRRRTEFDPELRSVHVAGT